MEQATRGSWWGWWVKGVGRKGWRQIGGRGRPSRPPSAAWLAPAQTAESELPEHLAHLSTEGEKRARAGRVSAGERSSPEPQPAASPSTFCPRWRAPRATLGTKLDQGPPSLLSRPGVRKKSIKRVKDHLVTLIFFIKKTDIL